MPPPQWVNDEDIPLTFTPVSARHYRGNRLPGTVMSVAKTRKITILIQEWDEPLCQLACRILTVFHKISIKVKERSGFRLEAVLSGELNLPGQSSRIRAGEYHLTNVPQYEVQHKAGSHCEYFVAYYPEALVKDFGVALADAASGSRLIPERMAHLIQEALHHPYNEGLRGFYYQNLVRQLFFIHLTHTGVRLPTELNDADIAAVYRADPSCLPICLNIIRSVNFRRWSAPMISN